MNHMKEVAQLLGLEIGEEFRIEGHSSNNIYRLTEENIEYLSCGHWYSISSTLNKLLNGEYKVAKMPILDDVEKRYLSRFIRPWRDKVILVTKEPYGDYEYIAIDYKNDDEIETECIPLPKFKKNTMYKGMKWGEGYSLEELNI